MLYLLYGSDTAKSRGKLSKLIESLLAKRPDAPLIRIEGEKYDGVFVEAQVGGMGLFAPRSIIVLDSIFKKADAKEHFCALIPAVATSDNIFVCVDEFVDVETLRIFEKHATKIEEHTSVSKKTEERGPLFAFTDAVAARSRGRAWLLYIEAKRKGFSVEEIHHLAFWQIKNMLIAKNADTPAEAGMKPFPFGKAKAAATKWSDVELRSLATTLISESHDDRRGGDDLELSFEKLLLSL